MVVIILCSIDFDTHINIFTDGVHHYLAIKVIFAQKNSTKKYIDINNLSAVFSRVSANICPLDLMSKYYFV